MGSSAPISSNTLPGNHLLLSWMPLLMTVSTLGSWVHIGTLRTALEPSSGAGGRSYCAQKHGWPLATAFIITDSTLSAFSLPSLAAAAAVAMASVVTRLNLDWAFAG